MREAIAAALQTLRQINSDDVGIVYQRGESQILLQEAGKGAAVYELLNSEGASVRQQGWDWLIAVEDLVLAGEPTEPQREDRILETVGEKTFVYLIVDDGGRPMWKYSDRGRTQFRVCTTLFEVR